MFSFPCTVFWSCSTPWKYKSFKIMVAIPHAVISASSSYKLNIIVAWYLQTVNLWIFSIFASLSATKHLQALEQLSFQPACVLTTEGCASVGQWCCEFTDLLCPGLTLAVNQAAGLRSSLASRWSPAPPEIVGSAPDYEGGLTDQTGTVCQDYCLIG